MKADLYGSSDARVRELKVALRALADVSRLRIVRTLAEGAETTVTELARAMKISQPLLSWHLRFLRRAGLVDTRRKGRAVYCTLNRERWQWTLAELKALATPQGSPVEPQTKAVQIGNEE
jgi:ArsR family transcriptional regulator